MKVVVDAQPVFGRRAGIGAYVYEVLKRLPGLLPDDDIRLILFRFLKSERIPEGMTGGNVTVRLHTLFPRKALEAGLKLGVPLPFHLFSGNGDVYLFPNFVAYPTGGKPSALIVYDLSYLRYPDKAEAKNQRFLTRFVPPSLERAKSILTISEFSQNEISEVYRIPPEKIRVAQPGVDPTLFHPRADGDEFEKIRAKYRLPSEYLLFVGTLEPRKGIEPLLAAYEQWEDREKPPLVLVGKRGWGDLPRLSRALRGGIKGVVHPGYVDQDDLPVLMSHARIFVYPSFYEGFGMPVLEAMACGTPVVCGNCPSFREIGGDLLTYCDPNEPDAIAAALDETLTSPPPSERREAAVQRARTFTWENTARVIAEALKEIAG
jgi:glycosyltransferase involved in cell wall biosynthesis